MADESNNEPLPDVVQAILETKQRVKGILADAKAKRRQRAENLAGPHWQDMCASFSKASTYLDHPDCGIREAALYAMSESPGDKGDFGEICKKRVLDDQDALVRFGAMEHLAALYSRSYDVGVGFFLAQIIRDDSRARCDRKWAYMFLLDVFGRVGEFAPIAMDDSLFPSRVDWKLVDSLLR